MAFYYEEFAERLDLNVPENGCTDVSFPYPEIGDVTREPDEGCRSCVHNRYCTAIYYSRRFNVEGPWKIPKNMGRACLEWSNDEADTVQTITQCDMNKNVENIIQERLEDPDGNVMPVPVNANTKRRDDWTDSGC